MSVFLQASSPDGGDASWEDTSTLLPRPASGSVLVMTAPAVPTPAQIQSGDYENFVIVSNSGNETMNIQLPVITADTPRLLRFSYSPFLSGGSGYIEFTPGAGNDIQAAFNTVLIGYFDDLSLNVAAVTFVHDGVDMWYVVSPLRNGP